MPDTRAEFLAKAASKAVWAVFSETSVSQQETRKYLDEIQGEIIIMLDCLDTAEYLKKEGRP